MRACILIFMIISFLRPMAQDRYFGQTYTTNVLPKGNIDFELWHTSRIGHSDQYFHGMEQRMEFEFGLGKNSQTAFYFNRYQTAYSNAMDEIVQNNEIGFSNDNEVIKGSWKNSVLYGGPTINYRSNRWFAIGNYLPQWVNLKKTQEFPNKKLLNELERMEARIIFGISF